MNGEQRESKYRSKHAERKLLFLPPEKMETVAVNTPKVRLKFIDMARTIAIMLMLEGHFVDDSLAQIYRDPENVIFTTWLYIRGFTAAMFLTVTGLIFVYLLLKNREVSYFQNIRIKKGFKRVLELIFWGFVVQYYAFHVLECIAIGIFTILIIYGLYKITRFVPLWLYFFAAGFIAFSFYLPLRELPKGMPWPENTWTFIQNAIHGPSHKTVFPVVPWIGFTMFGAMIGALLHDFHHAVKKWYFPLFFLLAGALMFFIPKELLMQLDKLVKIVFPHFSYQFVYLDWIFIKLGMVIMVLSALMIFDRYWGEKINDTSLFLKLGQNTLTIYVLHMIILYGSVTGIGLNDFFHKNLGPWEVTFGAILFMAFFVLLVKYIDVIRMKLGFILVPIRKAFNKLFLIS